MKNDDTVPDAKTLLLVEDEAIIAMAEAAELRKAGYDVVHVTNGEKATDLFRRKTPEIDLILMDIDLGTGMDGTEAAREILATAEVPLVFLSSHTEPEYVARTEEITSYGYVVKHSGSMVLLRSITMAFRLFEAHQRQKAANRRLMLSERKYQLLFENLTAGFALHGMVYDDEGRPVDYRFLDVNPRFEELTGLKSDSLIGRTVREVLPETESYWIETYARVVKTGESIAYENYSRELGRYYDVWAFRHDTDQFAVVINDVTERRRMESDLRRHKDYLATTLQSIGDAIITTDQRGNVIILNPVAEHLTGWSQEEAAGRPLLEVFNIVNARTREPAFNPVATVLSTGRIVGLANHTVLISRGGTEYQIADSAAPITNGEGTVEGVVLVFRDVTEEYRIQSDLTRSEALLSDVLESVQEGIVVIGRDFTIQLANPALKSWFPGGDTVVGRSCFEVLRNRDTICPECPAARAFGSGEVERSEIFGYGDSLVQWTEVFAYPMVDRETGEINGVVEFLRDITELKKMQQSLGDARWRLGAIIESTNLATWEWNVRTGEMVFNERWAEIAGYSLEALAPMSIETWRRMVHPDDLVRSVEHLERHFSGETEYYEVEVRMRHKDGRWVWVRDRGQVFTWTDEGKPEWMFGTHEPRPV